MTLVIADALPPAPTAHALGEAFASRYPNTVDWFNARSASFEHWPIREHGCTPIEGWQLMQLGFQPPSGLAVGAGLAPWLARTLGAASPKQPAPVWIATLCSTIISQERATAVPLSLLNVQSAEMAALAETAKPLLADAGDGIELVPLDDGIWQVTGPLPEAARTITPMALMGQDLGDWWPTGDAWRAWRKRLNEIQMAWHDHPVNQARERQGQPALNGLWLFGGGLPFEPTPRPDLRVNDQLGPSATEGDWSAWLDAWADIEQLLLAGEPDETVVLTGPDCLVHLTNAPTRWWRSLLNNKQKDTWRQWWINRT